MERERRGLRQKDAADLLGVEQPTYQRWESLVNDVDKDRELHARLREYLRLSEPDYALAALEQALVVRERRRLVAPG